MTSSSYALDVHHLRKVFTSKKGDLMAVSDLSFTISPGEIVGLLGINGAGKSTTIQMLLGTLTPTSGTIHYGGLNLQQHRAEILERVGFVDGYSRMPGDLTVWENLNFYGSLYSMPSALRHRRIGETLELFGCEQLRVRKCNTLSAGQATRVALVRAFMMHPTTVLLDEPTASLDPDICSDIRAFLIRQKREHNVAMLYTSHNMAEVAEVCDRVIFLKGGAIVEEDTPHNLTKKVALSTLRLRVPHSKDRFLLYKLGNDVREDGEWIELRLPHEQIAVALQEITRRGINFSDLEVVKPSLEDFFIKIARQREDTSEAA